MVYFGLVLIGGAISFWLLFHIHTEISFNKTMRRRSRNVKIWRHYLWCKELGLKDASEFIIIMEEKE